MSKVKLLFLIGLMGLIFVSLALFFRGGPSGFGPSHVTGSLPQHVDMQLSGVNYTEVTSGDQEWTLEAETLRNFKSSRLMVFDRVKITFFSENGSMLVSGDQARYDKKSKTVRVIGGVRVMDNKGYLMIVDELSYDVKKRMLLATGPFRITGPKYDLDGLGLSVDMKESRMKVFKKPRLLIKSVRKIL